MQSSILSNLSFIVLKYFEETPFSVENGCLTISLKKARPFLAQKYKEVLQKLLKVDQSDTEEKLKGIPIVIS
jgi:hypothetical protein